MGRRPAGEGGSGVNFKRLLLVLAAGGLLGYWLGLGLPEEKKHRYLKLAGEAREMPFRLFV
jgi:membrane protein YqaA with SNARE-associated domain